MAVACPKCGGEMMSIVKKLSTRIGPFPVKNFLPPELQEYDSMEMRICTVCGYMELYWLKHALGGLPSSQPSSRSPQ